MQQSELSKDAERQGGCNYLQSRILSRMWEIIFSSFPSVVTIVEKSGMFHNVAKER